MNKIGPPQLLRGGCVPGSDLHFGSFTVPSEEGAQQGDPLGPLLFCLALHDILTSLKSELVLGYLDDVALGGDANIVMEDLIAIEATAADIGLTLNRSKCEVVGHTAGTRALFAAQGIVLQETELAKVMLLGAPLLPGANVDSVLAVKGAELQVLSGRLPLMPAHDGLFLLANIISMPRLLYTLRTAPCTGSAELHSYDKQLRSLLCTMLNINLSETAWEQASLPVGWGGLGIRSAVMLAPSAYLASAAGAANLIQNLLPTRLHSSINQSAEVALTAWKQRVDPTVLPPVAPHSSRQKIWDISCCRQSASTLLSSASDADKRSRLLASVEDTSGLWLRAIPISSIGLKLGDDEVRIAAGLRLGVKLCEPHVCRCGVHVDARGTHGLACKVSAGRHPRHSQLNDVVWRALLRAQIPAVREPSGLSRVDGKRPDGVTMIPWLRGRCLTWDVTSPDTLAQSHITESAQKAGSAAAKAEASKTMKYTDIAQTHEFVPLAFETLGSWGTKCKNFVCELGRRITQVTGEARETTYLKQRLSIAIQRGNAIACRGTLLEFLGGGVQ